MAPLKRDKGSLYQEVHECPLPWVERPATILFCHGVGINADIWSAWLPGLLPRFRVVRFDLRGFGRSPAPGKGYRWSLKGLVEDVLAVADAAGAERFHLVGESLGGTIALAAAISHGPRLLSATACSAAHKGGSIQRVREWRAFIGKEGMDAWSEQMMPLRFHQGAVPYAVWRWFHEVQRGSPADSVLLLAPDASPFVSLDITREMHKAIPGAELQVFAGARHGLACSHAIPCAQTLADFIARRAPG